MHGVPPGAIADCIPSVAVALTRVSNNPPLAPFNPHPIPQTSHSFTPCTLSTGHSATSQRPSHYTTRHKPRGICKYVEPLYTCTPPGVRALPRTFEHPLTLPSSYILTTMREVISVSPLILSCSPLTRSDPRRTSWYVHTIHPNRLNNAQVSKLETLVGSSIPLSMASL